MSLARNLLVTVLALAGSLSWGPPTVLAICLAGRAPTVAVTASCCRSPAPDRSPAVDGHDRAGCRGCCAKVRVGLGLDGAGPRADVVVAPAAPERCLLPGALAFAHTAEPLSRPVPRPPPEKVLPLRI